MESDELIDSLKRMIGELVTCAFEIGAARSSGNSKRIFEAREDRVAASKRLDEFLNTLTLVQK
jgi:hypothetical protein